MKEQMKKELIEKGYNCNVIEQLGSTITNLHCQLGRMQDKKINAENTDEFLDYLFLQKYEIYAASRELNRLYSGYVKRIWNII